MRSLTLLVLLTVAPAMLSGQAVPPGTEPPVPVLSALRVEAAPTTDGRLEEEVWTSAESATAFTQLNPSEGEPASERTEVRVLYDDAAFFAAQPDNVFVLKVNYWLNA